MSNLLVFPIINNTMTEYFVTQNSIPNRHLTKWHSVILFTIPLSVARECPEGMEWMECGPNCNTDCQKSGMPDCKEECIEGCQCRKGSVYDQMVQSCVPRKYCSCLHRGLEYTHNSLRYEKCDKWSVQQS